MYRPGVDGQRRLLEESQRYVVPKYGQSADIGRSQEALEARGDSPGLHFRR